MSDGHLSHRGRRGAAHRLLAGLGAAALVIALQVTPIRAATSWNYGGSSPTCPGTTVQDCVNNAGAGDTIFLFKDDTGPAIVSHKSVSIKSGDGNFWNVGTISITDSGASSAILSTVSGLEVTGFAQALLSSFSGASIIFRNLIVYGATGHDSVQFHVEQKSATFRLENSTVVAMNTNAVHVSASNNGSGAFDIVANRISGHGATGGAGILAQMYSGNSSIDIYNNAVWDVARGAAGADSGIGVLASGTGTVDANVVGNTVELSATAGIYMQNSMTAGSLTIDMFNNTVSHATGSGFKLDLVNTTAPTFRAGYNNTFASGANFYDGLAKGPGNLAVNPTFVNASTGNLQLKSSSGLINKGQVCSPGGVANPDAANHHRLKAKSVDIGAYESGAGLVTGIVYLGTGAADVQDGSSGDDIMCGYAGNDTLSGLVGNDFIDGGIGSDLLYGNSGVDRLLGGKGDDTLCANDAAGGDFLNGGKGNDGFKADSGDVKKSVERASSCPN